MNALINYFMNCSITELVMALICAAIVVNMIKSIVKD